MGRNKFIAIVLIFAFTTTSVSIGTVPAGECKASPQGDCPYKLAPESRFPETSLVQQLKPVAWVALATIIIDQATKAIVNKSIEPLVMWPGAPPEIVAKWAESTFGIVRVMQMHVFPLWHDVINYSAGGIIIYIGLKYLLHQKNRWAALTMGLMLGGSLSNIAERVLTGGIIDWIYVGKLHNGFLYGAEFNLADVGIIIAEAVLAAKGIGAIKKKIQTRRIRLAQEFFRKIMQEPSTIRLREYVEETEGIRLNTVSTFSDFMPYYDDECCSDITFARQLPRKSGVMILDGYRWLTRSVWEFGVDEGEPITRALFWRLDMVGGEIELALWDAITNAVVHGNRSVNGAPIIITWDLSSKELTFRIYDLGKGGTIDTPAPAPQRPWSPSFSGRGLGVKRMCRVFDSVKYERLFRGGEYIGAVVTLKWVKGWEDPQLPQADQLDRRQVGGSALAPESRFAVDAERIDLGDGILLSRVSSDEFKEVTYASYVIEHNGKAIKPLPYAEINLSFSIDRGNRILEIVTFDLGNDKHPGVALAVLNWLAKRAKNEGYKLKIYHTDNPKILSLFAKVSDFKISKELLGTVFNVGAVDAEPRSEYLDMTTHRDAEYRTFGGERIFVKGGIVNFSNYAALPVGTLFEDIDILPDCRITLKGEVIGRLMRLEEHVDLIANPVPIAPEGPGSIEERGLPVNTYSLPAELFPARANLIKLFKRAFEKEIPGSDPIIAVRGALIYNMDKNRIHWGTISDFDLIFYLDDKVLSTGSEEERSKKIKDAVQCVAQQLEGMGIKVIAEASDSGAEECPLFVSIVDREGVERPIAYDIKRHSDLKLKVERGVAIDPFYTAYNPHTCYYGSAEAMERFDRIVSGISHEDLAALALAEYDDLYDSAKEFASKQDPKAFKRLAQLYHRIGNPEKEKEMLSYAHALDFNRMVFEEEILNLDPKATTNRALRDLLQGLAEKDIIYGISDVISNRAQGARGGA